MTVGFMDYKVSVATTRFQHYSSCSKQMDMVVIISCTLKFEFHDFNVMNIENSCFTS